MLPASGRRLIIGFALLAALAGLGLSFAGPGVSPAVPSALFALTVAGLLAGLLGARPPVIPGAGGAAASIPAKDLSPEGVSPEAEEPITEVVEAAPPLPEGASPAPSLLMVHDAPEDQLRALREELARSQEALQAEVARRKHLEADLAGLSDQDPLTGLPGRRLLTDRFTMAVAHAQRQRQKLAILLLEVDGLAGINEKLGQGHGDDLIRSVAVLLERSLRQGDTISRLGGGDEFTVLLPGVKLDENVAIVAEKLRLVLQNPFSIGGHDLTVTASMGIALHPDDGPDLESLLRSAHIALQRAKDKGGDAYDIHSPQPSAMAAERQALEGALRKALVQQALSLVYQPIVACETGAIVGVEALLRWRNPDERTLSAAEFVPLADATGLSVPLGQWALRNACVQGKAWLDAGHTVVMMVNVSPRQLHHPSLVKLVKRALEETGLPPAFLELEVPEAELAYSPQHSLDRLTELKALGLRVSIDDFGIGDSVLSQLHRYPVDALKIDKGVIRDIATDRNREAVATAAIALARARKLKVVAEGVETEAQRVLLARWQCDRIQGNLIGPPVSARDIETLLARQKRTALAP